MDIFSYESARRIGDQNVLRKVDTLMDWSLVLPLLKSGLNRSGLGPQGYDEIVLFTIESGSRTAATNTDVTAVLAPGDQIMIEKHVRGNASLSESQVRKRQQAI